MAAAKNKTFAQLVWAIPHFTAFEPFEALRARHGDTLALVQAVIDAGVLSKDAACRCWAESLGLAYVDPFASIVTDEAVASFPAEIARKADTLGLYIVDGVVTAAMADPRDEKLVERLGRIAKIPVSPVFALPRDIQDAISVHYSTEKGIGETLQDLDRSNLFDNLDDNAGTLAEVAETESLVRLFDDIVHLAIRERATDIHVEAQEMQSRIRFRVDGYLREIASFSRKIHRPLVSRIKILSELNISETRLPQDGRFTLSLGNHRANFRVSTIPTAYGEKAVVRLLTVTGRRSSLTLEKMMVSQSVLHPLRRLIRSPNGIIFVTGPTGSGKTTTLYSALEEINQPDINISTIEDPIEIQLAGVNQSQTHAQIDLRFSTLLRSLLRQDPDVILVGEIRDIETAKIATEAALTGHLVLATLHTNTAPQAIIRLVELGVEPYMVAPAVIGVLAQRLVARICEDCKEAYQPSRATLLKYFKEEGLTDVTFHRGRGCPACRNTGYRGRVAFHELVLITEEIRTLINDGKSAQEITRAAARVGYKPLRYDALKKVLLGLTTIDEVEANTSIEWED